MASKEQVITFLEEVFPKMPMTVDECGNRGARMTYHVSSHSLRPGGTVNGPTMMLLADVAIYVAIQGEGDIIPMAVTSSLNFNFLRRPRADANLIGVCKLLKMGRSLAVGEVTIFSEGEEDSPVCHATGTYALPAK